MKRITAQAVILIVFTISGIAQHLGAYHNYLDRFFIFDHGSSEQIEHMEVESFKIGGECVLYIDNSGHLKLYYEGIVSQLDPGGVTGYYVSDRLGAYTVYDKLYVVDRGQAKLLTARATRYLIEDSLIAYYDKNKESLNVYYNGDIIELETGIIGQPAELFASGDNIVAYLSTRNRDFRVFYNGKIQTLISYTGDIKYEAGRDIVAYVEQQSRQFKVFYKGEVFELESFPPRSFKTGDGFVVYVSSQGEFKYFGDQGLFVIGSNEPEEYHTEDNILIYKEHGYFKTFFDGRIYEIEPYIPSLYKLDWNAIAYLDNSNRIWLFQEGEKKYLLNEFVKSFDLIRNLIIMHIGVNRKMIYYQGEFYEGN